MTYTNDLRYKELAQQITVIVRTVNERTTETCINLIAQVIPIENINVISEIPFSRAVRKSFEIGIEEGKKWTLVIDADVLVRSSFIDEMFKFAEVQPDNTFVIQGLIHDKIFNVLRPAGNHLFRTKYLESAMESIPPEGSTLRPESATINNMVDKGYLFIQNDLLVGLHDYEQDYLSIAKKSFVHTHKHQHLIPDMLPYWEENAQNDLDYHAMIMGVIAGSDHYNEVIIDSNFLDDKCVNLLDKNIFTDKPPLLPSQYDEDKVNQILASALKNSHCLSIQERVFPKNRWNRVFKKQENVTNTNDEKKIKLTYVAYGPNQINGPNIWLQRILPELKKRGFQPKVIFIMFSDGECEVVKNLQQLGIECITVSRKKYTEENIIQLLEILKSDPPDIFIPNLSVPAYYAAKWVSEAGIQTVGIIRSDDNFHHELIDYFVAGNSEYQLSGVVCKSKFLEETTLSKRSGNTKVLRSASGTVVPMETAKEPANDLKLIYTGRLVQRQKRIFDVINSLKKVVTEIPGTSASLYGPDRESGKVISTINALNLGEKLAYKGLIPYEDIYPTLIDNHVFVLLSEYEGMSTSLMEAMACGLVPICTKTRSGSMEIIKHNENGLLVDNMEEDFIKAVKRLKNEKGLWKRLSEGARKTIQEEYSLEICVDKWTNFLNELLKENKYNGTINVPDINSMNLPPVKNSDNGLCREDVRMPLNKNTISVNDNFINPVLSQDNMDLYLVRKSIKESIEQNLNLFKGTLLDIGCGEMPYKQYILSNSRVEKYIGLDIENPTYQQNAKPDLFWDGKQIPLEDNSVDCVIATEFFEHVPYPEKILAEVNRVLKPEGFLFLTVPFIWPLHTMPHDEYRYTPFSLERILRNSGFEDVNVKSLGGWDASFAQVMGLWIRRRPLSDKMRKTYAEAFFPFYKTLIESDEIPDHFNDSMLITGLTATARKKVKYNSEVKDFTDKVDDKKVECPICGGTFDEFLPYGVVTRPNVLCPDCASLERHRLLWLFLKNKTKLFKDNLSLLDIAPTRGLSDKFKSLPNINYLSIDLNSSLAMKHMDITALDLDDNSFDCVICYHVFEHIPNDRQAMREILRVMKPGGWAILQVPIRKKLEKTHEGAHITDPLERKRLFGQEDHVRYYGLDYKDRLEEAGFIVNVIDFVNSFSTIEQEKYRFMKNEEIYFCTKPVSYMEKEFDNKNNIIKTNVANYCSTEDKKDNVLAIVCPQVGAVSETFIRKHIENLAPAKTVILTGSVLDKTWFTGPVKIIPIKIGKYSFESRFAEEVLIFLKEHSVTNILCEFGCIGAAVIELNKKTLNLPTYVHFHGQDASEFIRKPEIADYYKWMGNVVDGVITVSKPMSERLRNVGIPEHKIQIIHYGVNYSDKSISNPEKSPCQFISVSRLVGKKGILFVLQAFEKASKIANDITLDIIGEGPLRTEIEDYLKSHNLERCIKLHGERPHSYVLEMMDKSSVFLQHSIVDPQTGNAEGLPLSILEASAHGLPVISTFHEGIPEAIEHETTGFLVKEGDWESMADYIVTLAKNGNLRKQMGLAGRKKILEEGFTVDAMIKKLQNYLGLSVVNNQIINRQNENVTAKKIKRILFVNHNLYPFENSGTPISTLNHALGMHDKGLEVAVLIPSPEVGEEFQKQVYEKFILYKLPRLDKYNVFLGELENTVLDNYYKSVEKIINDFKPDLVQINDYVYMPEEIISLFKQNGISVIRNVCNLEEICHMDYPVVSSGLQGKLCSGPESPEKCAECFLLNKVGKKKEEIDQNLFIELASRIKRRFESVQKLYDNSVDGIIFTEKAFKDYFTRFININERKTAIIPRGIYFGFERKISAKEIPSKNIRFAFIGNVMFSKGMDVVLNAFEEIDTLGNFTLDIYGSIVDKDYREWIENLMTAYPEKINYHGSYKKEEFEKIAATADVALVTSYFDTYNRVVRELLYLGVPIIATNFFGSSIIQTNVNGLKINVGDHKALSDAMRKLISNPQLIHELSLGAIHTNIPSLSDEISGMEGFYDSLSGVKDSSTCENITDVRSLTRLIAFYLPQYHPIPENDKWWGKGFTEWTNVRKAPKVFPDHYQPHVPCDLGYYDLRDAEAREAQATLAREYGIYGFCYYHYWFNGKRLLNYPIDENIKSGKPDFPFCLCWANEDWTRVWDGKTGEALIRQNYNEKDDVAHIRHLLKYFKDERYIKINGKPLFLVYRASKIPNPLKTTNIWREEAKKVGLDLYLCRVESSSEKREDPRALGFDSAVEFQPDWENLPQQIHSPEYGLLRVYSYKKFAESILKKPIPSYKRYPCVLTSWDNSPRRVNDIAQVFVDSNPSVYEDWLSKTIRKIDRATLDDKIVFINAWNEWGEGNHLEPDQKYGRGYLEATKRALITSAERSTLGERLKISLSSSNIDANFIGSQRYSIAIRICTPTRNSVGWGDTFFGQKLVESFQKLGHPCRLYFKDEWSINNNHDISIHIRGLYRYSPAKKGFNILWVISHPELITKEELEDYDLIFCASKLFTEQIKTLTSVPCYYMPQATDDSFLNYPTDNVNKNVEILFVGNNYEFQKNKRRKIVQDVLDTKQKYDLKVIGQSWEKFFDQKSIAALFIESAQLPEAYKQAKINLNDHHPTMVQYGFINNRTFDIAALKQFQISNYVPGIEEFGIVTYKNTSELKEKLNYYLSNENARNEVALHNYEKCKEHTFLKRAEEIISFINSGKISVHLNCKKNLSDYKNNDKAKRENIFYNEPFISICIPTYNRSQYIVDAVQSALNQNYTNYEIIIVDDGSTDSTSEVMKNICDDKIRYIRKNNEGRPKTRNRLIREAKGDYILWLDDDDLLVEGVLELYADLINSNRSIDVIYGNLQLFDSATENILQLIEPEDYTDNSKNVLSNLISGKGITFPGSLIRKSMIEEVGGFNEDFLRAQDNELWSRLALKAKFYKVNEIICFYRKHENNVSMNSFADRSYESQIIRTILSSFPLKDIYTSLNWNDSVEAESMAFVEAAKGLYGFGDFYNAAKVLKGKKNNFSNEETMFLFVLYLKSGDISKAKEVINSRKKKLTEESKNNAEILIAKYEKLASILDEKRIEYLKDELEKFINVEGYSFIPALVTGNIFETIGDFESAYHHLQKAVYYNPTDENVYVLTQKVAQRIGKEIELANMRKRMLEEIVSPGKNIKSEIVSVIVPTFNRKEKLLNAIESVVNQTIDNWEIIIVNDSGEDVQDIVDSFNDSRIKLFSHDKNKGLAAARNTGIKNAAGKFIALLDDDDVFYTDHLETALKYLNEGSKVVYTDAVRKSYHLIDGKYILVDQSVPYSMEYDRNKLLLGNIAPVNCFVFEKSLIEKAGLFDENLPVLEDWEFWLRFSSITDFKHIKRNTVQVNWYNDGSTMTSSKQNAFEKTRSMIYKKYEKEIDTINNVNEIVAEFNAIWQKDNTETVPLVSIIALSYNQTEYTKAFVESLIQFTNVSFELILVDNASEKKTIEYLNGLSESSNNIKVIFNKENLGFPKGVNQGIKAATGKYILVANNDIVLTEGWLHIMIDIAESDSRIGLVGPISNDVSGVQLDKKAKYESIEEMHSYAGKLRQSNKGKWFDFPRVAFLCTLIKKEVIDKIGGLDERFSPGNFEDDDFCLRAQLTGYKTIVAEDVFIHHFGSKSFKANGTDKYAQRLEYNKQLFIEKWGADPEEIWLKGKNFNKRNPVFPINTDPFVENMKRAMIYLEDKDFRFAQADLNNAIDTYENSPREGFEELELIDLLNLAGNTALMNWDLQSAQENFEKELQFNPTSSRACVGLGEVFLNAEMYEEAKTMFEWSLKYNPANNASFEGLKKVNGILQLEEEHNTLENKN